MMTQAGKGEAVGSRYPILHSSFCILHSPLHSPLPSLEPDELDGLVAVDPPQRLALDVHLGLAGHARPPGRDRVLEAAVDVEDVLAFLVRVADLDPPDDDDRVLVAGQAARG